MNSIHYILLTAICLAFAVFLGFYILLVRMRLRKLKSLYSALEVLKSLEADDEAEQKEFDSMILETEKEIAKTNIFTIKLNEDEKFI